MVELFFRTGVSKSSTISIRLGFWKTRVFLSQFVERDWKPRRVFRWILVQVLLKLGERDPLPIVYLFRIRFRVSIVLPNKDMIELVFCQTALRVGLLVHKAESLLQRSIKPQLLLELPMNRSLQFLTLDCMTATWVAPEALEVVLRL